MTKPCFRITFFVLFSFFIFFSSGCTHEPLPESGYGNSVRSMLQTQTANPRSGAFGLNGEKAIVALDLYENYAGQYQEVKQIGISSQLTQTQKIGGSEN